MGGTPQVHANASDTVNGTIGNQPAIDASNAAAQSAAQKSPTDPKLDQKTSETFGTIMTWIMSLFAWLLGVAALTLDYSVYFTVVRMGDYVHNLTAIGVAWRILRDIGNIALIFGFLAIGISVILNTDMLGYGKKLLPTLIICAVALNFSLFFAEAVIDVGNLFATQFFTQINGGTPPTAQFLKDTTIGSEGISNKIMAQLGLSTLYTNGKTTPNLFSGGNAWLIGFMGIILFIVAAFVMFALALILVARFVILIFLIILAPIGIAGLAIPKLSSSAHKWWSKLFEQTITAPVLLLLLYVALAVITDASFLTGFGVTADTQNTGAWTQFAQNQFSGFPAMILTFLVAMGLLIFVTIAAKSLSAFGASWAIKTAGAASFGVSAWATNRTVGRGLYHLGRYARSKPGFNKFDALTGRVGSRIMDRAATGSFDIRSTGLLKNLAGGVDAGKAAEGGFAGARKRNIEDHEKAVKAIDAASEDRNLQKTAAAAQVRANAEKEHKEATAPIQQRIDAQEAETKRLKGVLKDYEENGTTGFKVMDAKAKLKQAEVDLKANKATLESETARILKPALDAEKKLGDTIAADKKAAKLAYASGIDHPINNIINPLNLIAYGPRTGEAAAKIVKATLKKDTEMEKLAKKLKEMNDEDGGEKKEKKDEKKDEPKPADAGH
jgi:hypothetical protein